VVVPTYGSYSYATSGSEKTSFPGTSRNFPSTTSIKIAKAGGCATRTWRPIPQHKEVQTLCPKGSNTLLLKSDQQRISFYGVSTNQKLVCGSKAVVYSTQLRAGDTWKFVCKSAQTTAHQVAEAIGFGHLTVAGKSVRVLHVHVTTTVTGSESGTSTQDYWYAPSLGLLVKNTGKVNAKQGNVVYTENYSLQLDSTTPSG
jgi:hypothetical protein